MAGFDKSLDKELFNKELDAGNSKISVGVFSYNGGAPKVQLSKKVANKEGEWEFVKVGRLNKDEVKAVCNLLAEAHKKM